MTKTSVKCVTFGMISLILLTGLYLRLYGLGHQSLWIDEVYTINAAMAVNQHGYPLLDSGNIYVNNFVSVYISAVITRFFGFDAFDPWALRLPAALFGAALIYAVYLLANRLFSNRKVSLMAAFLTAFSYSEIVFSRQVRGYAVLALLMVLVMYFLLKYIDGAKRGHLIWAIVFFILAGLSHWVALAFLPAIFLIVLFILKSKAYFPNFSRENLATISLVMLVCLTVITIVLFEPVKSMIIRYIIFPILPFLATLLSFYAMKAIKVVLPGRSLSFKTVLFPLFLISITYSFLTFYPTNHYELRMVSPQPDYKEAFSIIKSAQKTDDLIISARPVLHRIYLKQDGLWLPRSPVRRGRVDYYTGLPAINDLETLARIVAGNHGYVVIEPQSFYLSSDDRVNYIKNNDKIRLVYQSGKNPLDMIWVYSF